VLFAFFVVRFSWVHHKEHREHKDSFLFVLFAFFVVRFSWVHHKEHREHKDSFLFVLFAFFVVPLRVPDVFANLKAIGAEVDQQAVLHA